MAINPTKDIADHLATQSTTLTVGTNVFYGLVRPMSTDCPAQSVFVLGTPGLPPNRTFGTRKEMRHAGIQVRIRSDTFQNGHTLARDVYRYLQTASVTNYEDVRSEQSEPAFLKQDERTLYHWSINFIAVYNST